MDSMLQLTYGENTHARTLVRTERGGVREGGERGGWGELEGRERKRESKNHVE